jgi:diguanylate cyclase (GGDEF)-like protein/PAS domain S-box-containing protein
MASFSTRQAEHAQTRETLQTQMRERLNQLQISSELFLQQGLRDHLQQLVASIASEPDLVRIVIVDADGRVIAADRFALLNRPWHKEITDLNMAQIAAVQSSQSVRTEADPEERYIDGYAGLCGHQDHSVLRPAACGFITYRLNLQYHYRLTDKTLRQQTGYFVIGILTVFVILLVVLNFLVKRRTGGIITALRAFVSGQRDARIQLGLNDEITWVGSTINQVLDEVQQNERDIVDQRERLRAVFDTVVDAIITINSRGIIQTVNPATERLFGYQRGELIGQNVSVLTPMPVRSEHDQYLNHYLETGERKVIGIGREVEAVTKSGDSFAAELSVSEMSIGGDRMFTGVIRDVSERVQLRQAMEQVNAELLSTNQALWQSAKTDGLTGLANRRHFDDVLDAEIRRAVRQGQPLSLLLIDLDYFKQFNDHYGHYDGDNCLKAVARVLMESCQRSGELPARYGGEEFAVILPYNDAELAMNMAERIRTAVQELHIPHRNSRVSDWVSASLGVTTYIPAGSEPIRARTLIQAADHALYDAKAAGRNRVCQAETPEDAQLKSSSVPE